MTELLHFSPMRENEVAQSCLTLIDPRDCSLPSSSIHGIFQARVLEWGAIAFSDMIARYFQNNNSNGKKLPITIVSGLKN